jgi:hypothetical protein
MHQRQRGHRRAEMDFMAQRPTNSSKITHVNNPLFDWRPGRTLPAAYTGANAPVGLPSLSHLTAWRMLGSAFLYSFNDICRTCPAIAAAKARGQPV